VSDVGIVKRQISALLQEIDVYESKRLGHGNSDAVTHCEQSAALPSRLTGDDWTDHCPYLLFLRAARNPAKPATRLTR